MTGLRQLMKEAHAKGEGALVGAVTQHVFKRLVESPV